MKLDEEVENKFAVSEMPQIILIRCLAIKYEPCKSALFLSYKAILYFIKTTKLL